MEFAEALGAWKQEEINLLGPFYCHGDKNPHTTVKVWGAVIEDMYSGAVHCDVVRDYSAQAVIEMMRKFAALRGWPSVISSDPGSQLVSAARFMGVLVGQNGRLAAGSGQPERVQVVYKPSEQSLEAG